MENGYNFRVCLPAWMTGTIAIAMLLILAPVQVQAANKLHLGESSGDSRLSDKPKKFLNVPNKGVPERPPTGT